jgi:hypothetical protein
LAWGVDEANERNEVITNMQTAIIWRAGRFDMRASGFDENLGL